MRPLPLEILLYGNYDTNFSRGTATGPSGMLAVSGVSGFATGFGARRLGASFAGTRVMATTAGFFCSAQRFRWAAAIRSRAAADNLRVFDLLAFEIEVPGREPFGLADCAIRVRASCRRAISASMAAMICSVSTPSKHNTRR
jgi:hypothetical protein